jgi:hypothetical protein
MGVGGQRLAPPALSPGKRPGTHCIGGWVGHRAGLDGHANSRPPPGFDPRTDQLVYRLRYPGPQTPRALLKKWVASRNATFKTVDVTKPLPDKFSSVDTRRVACRRPAASLYVSEQNWWQWTAI